MTLVFDRRAQLAGGAATHAFICGISEYPHLEGGSGVSARFGLKLRQLDGPSRTAVAIAKWLIEKGDDLAAPLATCRLLLAPGATELDAGVSGFGDVEVPTLDNVLHEAAQWRSDASRDAGGMTLLYLAGHGLQLHGSASDPIVLLPDFGNGIGSFLRNTVDVRSLFLGMAPSRWTEKIARRQLYFIDTGREAAPLPDAILASSLSAVFDAPLDTLPDDRVAITFYASAPGRPVYAEKGSLTLFGGVLLDCLRGSAASSRGRDGWAVTTQDLAVALPRELKRRAEHLGVQQDVVVSGLLGNEVVLELSGPPEVSAVIELPEGASEGARLSVLNAELQRVAVRSPSQSSEPVRVTLPAGPYIIELEQPGRETVRRIGFLNPSSEEHFLTFEE